ncbi:MULTISPECIES: efflux transporter outer membrane subunit [unclassified Acidovorax]|uniref:efflux transporter outer membrane subunit n=1 Tax=unclassified Acidovorax TaxID=2684926 RepID=UPI000BC715E7|nr:MULTISPECIES: efflux transporter outer membrane subunit [unclassified Acidovorax]OYX11201.1 MAG: transporter [Acidovorax sp. 32-64-7]HQS22398.1 efflux transporter outer membrane subunit [Acidovorax defluvii]OYY27244.1 MAG: transporter [Acidovorax sp. 35-64-16]OYY82500.1 MAG: transporter [Acidovorax sp. 28-64-14]OYZ43837.1 MAG: transporter [Acidovorax sp. 16-64-162]
MSRIPLIAPRRTVVRATAASALALLALAGCTSLAPDYARPMLPVPATLNGTNGPNGSEGTALAPETGPMGWQEFLQEPRLRELVALALQNNRDLRVAVLAIEKARAQYGVEQSSRFPAVGATAAGNRTRTADDLNTSGRSPTSSQYSAQLGFSSYEIDFFGRVKNLNEAALQEFLRTTENRRSVQLSLVAEVANAWLTLDADGRRLQLAQDTLRSRQKSYELTERSHALGAASGLTLAQAQTTVDTARADVAAFTSQVARDRNALALLAGAPVPAALLPDGANPGATASPAQAASASASVAPAPSLATPAATLLAVPGDLPSSVLLNRPDVRAAEYTLRGAYASIGAARAAFFPSITLTASAGTASNALSGLFDGGNGTWSFAPQIRLPIFDAGRNRANLQIAETARDTALAQYDKAVQTAFREVADALAERATLAERLQAQQSLQAATLKALQLSQARYRLGADSYLPVLDAQRALYSAQQTLIGLALAEQANRITLYKVLGGRWIDTTPGDSTATPGP